MITTLLNCSGKKPVGPPEFLNQNLEQVNNKLNSFEKACNADKEKHEMGMAWREDVRMKNLLLRIT
jgi:hypothetical protein